jgi:ankyrin repeat protein
MTIHDDVREWIRSGDVDALRSAIASGNQAILNVCRTAGLPDAIEHGEKRIIALLLEIGADPVSGLRAAVERGDRELLARLIAAGATPSTQRIADKPIGGSEQTGMTLLMLAAADPYSPDVVSVLVHAGVSVDAVDDNGWTALHHAASTEIGSGQKAKALLDHGAQVDAQTPEGVTPLHVAVKTGAREVAEVLLAVGANAEHKALEPFELDGKRYAAGTTPLDIARRRGKRGGPLLKLLEKQQRRT